MKREKGGKQKRERPISLAPLTFKEALGRILQVKPPKKSAKKK
jgi:hypothetical protein